MLIVVRRSFARIACVYTVGRVCCTSLIAILMIANCQAENILLIAYSFSCDPFDRKLWKNSQFAIKESRNQNPTYGIRSSVRMRMHLYPREFAFVYMQKGKRSFLRAYA